MDQVGWGVMHFEVDFAPRHTHVVAPDLCVTRRWVQQSPGDGRRKSYCTLLAVVNSGVDSMRPLSHIRWMPIVCS